MSRYSKANLRAGLRNQQAQEPSGPSLAEAAQVEDVLFGPPSSQAVLPKPQDPVISERPASR